MKWLYLIICPLLLFGNEEELLTSHPETETIHEEITPSLSADMYQKQFVRTLIVTAIIVIAAFLIIWLFRKFAKDRPFQINHKKNIKILERRQISPSTFLYHIQIGNKQLILSESKLEARVVTTLDWDEDNLAT